MIDFQQFRQYIKELVQKNSLIYSEDRMSIQKYTAAIIFKPKTPKMDIIGLKHDIANYVDNCYYLPDYISKRRVKLKDYILVTTYKTLCGYHNVTGAKKKIKLPILIIQSL